MTFRELFEEVESRGLMDAQFGVKYRDEGGYYSGWEEDDDFLVVFEQEREGKDSIYLI